MRKMLQDARPLSEEGLRALDSTLKKNSAFVKKLKNITDDHQNLLSEFYTLRLTKYLTEAVEAIMENRFRAQSDVQMAVRLCAAFQSRYFEFRAILLPKLLDCLKPQAPGPNAGDDLGASKSARQRQFLRLFIELCLIGLAKDENILLSTIASLIDESDATRTANMPFVQLVAKGYAKELLSDAPSEFLSLDVRRKLVKLFREYFAQAEKYRLSLKRRIKKTEERNREIYDAKGDLSVAQQTLYDSLCAEYEKLFGLQTVLSSALSIHMDTEHEEGLTLGSGLVLAQQIGAYEQQPMDRFANAEEMAFYESIPDLAKMCPPGVLPPLRKRPDRPAGTLGENLPELMALAEKRIEDSINGVAQDDEGPLNQNDASLQKSRAVKEFVANLGNISTTAKADRAAIDFCSLVTKHVRTKLMSAVFSSNASSLPYLCRILRILDPYFDLCDEIIPQALGEFRFLFKKRGSDSKRRLMERRMSNVRLLCELTLFRLLNVSELFKCVNILVTGNVDDIEVLVELVDNIGRYLYALPETRKRMEILLSVLQKRRTDAKTDDRGKLLAEIAIESVCPSEVKIGSFPKKSVMAAFIRYLLLEHLNADTKQFVFEQVRSLNFSDRDTVAILNEAFTNIHKSKHSHIPLIASVLGGLKPYHSAFCAAVVDNVLEDIRIGLELCLPQMIQRRLMQARYLAEMYNYCLVESDTIIGQLYLIVTFGHMYQDGMFFVPHRGAPQASHTALLQRLDAPNDFVRVSMVCEILSCCGHYFTTANDKHAVRGFIQVFEQYLKVKDLKRMSGTVLESITDMIVIVCGEERSRQMKKDLQEAISSNAEDAAKDAVIPKAEVSNSESVAEAPAVQSADATEAEVAVESEFDKDLRQMLQSGLESRLTQRVPTVDIAVPLGSNSSLAQMSALDKNDNSDDPISVRVLIKKKNKSQTRQVYLSSDTTLAKSLISSVKSEIEERREAAKIVLGGYTRANTKT